VLFHLIAYNPDLYHAWKKAFAQIPEVSVSEGNILAHRLCLLGEMETQGGLAGAVRQHMDLIK
jgi:hypothetical protein